MIRLPELDDALQDLAEELGRRLVVVDQSMRVVAYSIHESPEDRRRLFHMLAHSDSWPRPRTAKSAHWIGRMPEVGPVMFIRLVDSRQQIIGHLILPCTESESEHEGPGVVKPVAPDTARHLADLLEARQQATKGRSVRSHQLTADLVAGDLRSREVAARELIGERLLSTSDSYCAVALGVDPRMATPADHEKTSQAVSRTLQFVRETSTASVVGATLDDQVGVLVFPRPVVVPRLTRILAHPQVAPVRAGVGPLTALNDVHRSFERAQLAWRATWLAPEDHDLVATWDGVGLDGTLARMPVEDFTLEDLPPATRDLLKEVNSPDLLSTLEAYLNAGGDAQQTARALRIHRSTLYYRLDKLRPLLPGDLSDGVLRRDLHTGLRMARLARLFLAA